MKTPKENMSYPFYNLQSLFPEHNAINFDLNSIYAGKQICPMTSPWQESHTFGPIIRDYYTVNYITRGHGILTLDGIDYNLHTGQIYVTFPGTVITLHTEYPDYWEYYYLYFKSTCASHHLRAMNFSEISPVFDHENISELPPLYADLIDMYSSDHNNLFDKTVMVCKMLNILYKYSQQHDSKNTIERSYNFIEKAIHFFEVNYQKNLSINDVARNIGLDRSYFSRVFKQHMHISPQDYLIRLRMKKACEFLTDPRVSISNIASSVGYEPFAFSRTFKKVTGFSPSEYQKNFKK